ncbi:MAG: hypothetical protein NXI24_06405 [bacterium]|nr:hypothetical protein [bacterium]
MQKKITILSLLLALLSFPLYAQEDPGIQAAEEELPDASIDVDLAFVSNYVFRGDDLFITRAQQKNESYGSHSGEMAFQPSITFNTPLEGLSFNIWGSFAMFGRDDVDTDQIVQTAPGSSTDVISGLAIGEPQANAIVQAAGGTADGITTTALSTNKETGGLPGYYAEPNGLKRLDELDFTIAYSADTKVGSIGFGFVAYTFPYISNGQTLTGGTEEIFVSYALPFLPELGLSVNADIDSSVMYYNLSYGSGVEITDGVSLDYGAGVGYGNGYLGKRVQGIQDVTGSIGISAYGFSVAYNIAYRPNLEFFDEDTSGNRNNPSWINGSSTAGDGLVADPSQTNGFVRTTINNGIGTAISNASGVNYTYTPRQKLPRTLWWISAGYSFSI